MKKLSFVKHIGLVTVALFGFIAVSAATAQAQYYRSDYGQQSVQVATNNGYQLGYGAGSNDRAYGRRFDINDHKAYRDADSGRSMTNISDNTYERLFRQGFEQGYRDGYYGSQRRGSFNPGYNTGGYYEDRYDYRDRRPIRRRIHRRDRVYVIPY
jgi:hypothetical protein